jgi:multiple sugar transport system substrate-binding protein
MKKIKWADFSRRQIMKAGAVAAATGVLPTSLTSPAWAGAEEDRIVASAKKLGKVDVTGILWSNYQVAISPVVAAFNDATGINLTKIQDISTFDIPQRAMAEALSKSPEFDFFHVDSNMIPSLASAGLLEPLDEYMADANFKINAVGDFGKFMTYKGKTYGMPTDGNVHVQFLRKDLFEDPEERKAFADKHGKEMAWPDTWEDELELYKWFHRPDDGIWSSGNLRDRGSSLAWFYMYFYSAGGFPFTDDAEPNINNDAGEYAIQTFLNLKEVSHPESPGWGTPQMIPRIVAGNTFGQQYWDGIIALAENPAKSKTAGKWLYGPVPGSRFSGKLVKRSISAPVVSILINRHSPRKAAMAYLAMYLATAKNSAEIVGDDVNTFHDPWHVSHFIPGSKPFNTYTAGGMKGIEQNLQITTPPFYLTGLLEFETELKRNISEAYTGGKTAKQVVADTTDAWSRSIRRIGKRRIREELATYKSLFPSVDVPS